jgi:hypothetical protein
MTSSRMFYSRDVAAQSDFVRMCDAATQADETLFARQVAQPTIVVPIEVSVMDTSNVSVTDGQDILNDGMIIEAPSSPSFPPLPSPSMLVFPDSAPSSPPPNSPPPRQPSLSPPRATTPRRLRATTNELPLSPPTNLGRRLRTRDPKRVKYTFDEEATPKKKSNKRKRPTQQAPIPKLVIPRLQLTAILSRRQQPPTPSPPRSPQPTDPVVDPPSTPLRPTTPVRVPSPTPQATSPLVDPPSTPHRPTTPVVAQPSNPPTTTDSPMDTSNITVVSLSESFTKDYLPDIDNLTQTVPPLPSPTASMIDLTTDPPELDQITVFLSSVPPVRRISL